MIYDHGQNRGPYPVSDEARALGQWQLAHGVVYRPDKRDMDLGHENLLRGDYGPGIMVPGYEPWPGCDRSLFWNGERY